MHHVLLTACISETIITVYNKVHKVTASHPYLHVVYMFMSTDCGASAVVLILLSNYCIARLLHVAMIWNSSKP